MLSFVEYEVVHSEQIEPITFYVRDTITNDLIDPISGSWSLIRIDTDAAVDTGTFGPSGGTGITRVEEGIYNFSFDAATYPYEYDLSLKYILQNETVAQDIFIKPISSKYYAYAARLSNQVDKARKSIKDEIENIDRSSANYNPSIQFFYGYSMKHYAFYLERGCQYLNAIPPYTSLTVDSFPFTHHGAILIDAATIAALESQGVFAIDTDYSYSLGGNSLVIDHYTKLSGFTQQILNRFQTIVLSWKQQFRATGNIIWQFTPGGMRTARLYGVLPSGYWSRVLSAFTQ